MESNRLRVHSRGHAQWPGWRRLLAGMKTLSELFDFFSVGELGESKGAALGAQVNGRSRKTCPPRQEGPNSSLEISKGPGPAVANMQLRYPRPAALAKKNRDKGRATRHGKESSSCGCGGHYYGSQDPPQPFQRAQGTRQN